MPAPAAVAERLARLLDPVAAAGGLVVEGVTVSTAGRRRLVRVVVDLPEDRLGAADLDTVAEVSRGIGDALDGLEGTAESRDLLGGGPYALEVSTPGTDRPLTERRHWLRARTRLVHVQLDGGGSAQGRLVEVDDDGLTLDVAGATPQRIGWDQVVRGRVEVEFRRPAATSAEEEPDDDAADEPGDDGAPESPED